MKTNYHLINYKNYRKFIFTLLKESKQRKKSLKPGLGTQPSCCEAPGDLWV